MGVGGNVDVYAYVPFDFGDDGRVGATGPLWMHSFGREEGYYYLVVRGWLWTRDDTFCLVSLLKKRLMWGPTFPYR